MTNQQDKAAFFAQYYGQKVLASDKGSIGTVHELTYVNFSWYMDDYLSPYLLLKPLESISDEDCIEVSTMYGLRADSVPEDALIEMGLSVIGNRPEDLPLNITDFLRSHGYAIPFRQYSVQDQQSLGWVKLKAGK